jgi:transposase-like protein
MARKATATPSKSRRLSPEEKVEIVRLHAAGIRKKDIAETIKTTPATVGRTIADAQNGSPTTIRTGRAAASTTAHDVDLTKRLKALAVAVVMEGSVDDDEKSALKEIIEQRISEAQSRAAQEALASL